MTMLNRLKVKIKKEIIRRYRNRVPHKAGMTYVEDGNQWYDPILAGPSIFLDSCCGQEAILYLLELFNKLTQDKYMDFVLGFYKSGMKSFGNYWRYADINTVLYGIASRIKIDSYLEIGVRKGRSMSVVAALSPEADMVGFDLWIEDYAGMENPGPDFVRRELENVGHKGDLLFVDGDSKKTVPRYFKQNPDKYFDLITVDGDHSRRGATIDLKNVIPRLKIGGFLVFDDISSPYHEYLKKVWERQVKNTQRFLTYEFTEVGLGVAFGIKKF
jgi:predicted O-methyltransferase YrrM